MTYEDLNAGANRLARRLIRAGIGRGDLVCVLCERSFEFLVAIYGILKAGAAYVPVDPFYPRERQRYVLRDSRSKILVTKSRFRGEAGHLLEKKDGDVELWLLDEPESVSEGTPANPEVAVEPDDLAYVIYTSGSTGEPKGVMITHEAIDNRLQWMQDFFRIGDGDTIAQKTSQSFDVSVWELFWPLQRGARMLIVDQKDILNPLRLHELVKEHEVSILHFVPSLLLAFLEMVQTVDASRRGLPSLKWAVTSGEALPAEGVRFWRKLFPEIPVANLYGPTEAAVDVTCHAIREDLPNEASRIPIGRPIANTQVLILDAAGASVPYGGTGEICLGGVQLAKGYWGKEALSREKFTPNADENFRDEIPLVYHTGDLGRFNGEGAIEYLGRLDHQVKIRGFRIELGEIEANLLKHPEVACAAVVAKEDVHGQKRLVGFVASSAGGTTERELKEYLREKVPEYMVPGRIRLLPEIPLNANGKIDRKKLMEEVA